MSKKILFPAICLALSACAPKNFEALQSVTSESTSAIGCASFESKAWDAVNRYLLEQQAIPAVQDLRDPLKLSLKNLKSAGVSAKALPDDKVDLLAADIEELYQILLTEAPQAENVQSAQELLGLLSALELGDQTTPSKLKLKTRVQAQFAKIQARVKAMDVACGDGEPTSPSLEDGDTRTSPVVEGTALPLPVYGIRFTFATAYQSCQALTEPIMNESTPDISSAAIKITGVHSDGVGNKRVIASVDSLVRTHPYYKNVNSYGAKCLNGRSYPMIYDYGGKPYAATGTTASLNLFKNSGGGTSALGIDCSGFVFSGLATAGLRLSPHKDVKASGVYGINSHMYLEPQNNGLSCLAKITVTPTLSLKAGDIVAVPGHVIMIDSIGKDPFGINDVKTTSSCAKLSSKNFDFVVIQSSPSKNAVGMNRFEAKDYLPESDKMRVGLERYAYYACLAKVNQKNYTPNLGTLSVIRHKLTSSCLGKRVKLAQETCIETCSQLAR